MKGYRITEGDVEAGPQERMEVSVEKKSSSTGWMWKVSGSSLLVALSIGGARSYIWYQSERSETTTRLGQTAAPIMMNPEETEGAHSTSKQMSKKAKAAIHLTGDYDEDSNGTTIEWKGTVDSAFAQGGLRLLSNKIEVPENGSYFVYSQASFRVSWSDEGEQQPVTLSHQVSRSSKSVGTKVASSSSVRSACQHSQEDDRRSGRGCYSTIYSGAVFKSLKGDTSETETSHSKESDTDEGKTFFGVFAL